MRRLMHLSSLTIGFTHMAYVAESKMYLNGALIYQLNFDFQEKDKKKKRRKSIQKNSRR
jgi:hypothetical protein